MPNGKTQKRYLEKEKYSPALRHESIMLSSLTYAYEKHYVATVDIKGASVHEEESHDCLGMVMAHKRERQPVKIDMERYIQETITSIIINKYLMPFT